ncbi:MAG TPA: pyrroline-5-carboxylate reductase [Phycisphaerales bacterium]|nr:pyrroline-5-carboxylate reductase [Phycisphaerales bacterium]
MNRFPGPLCFIGGGNMARAIFDGARAAGVIDPAQVLVAEPDEHRRAHFNAAGVTAFADTPSALSALRTREGAHPGAILLAVKPQVLASVAPDLRAFTGADSTPRTLISILAGTTTAKLQAAISNSIHIIRAMPNTPAQVLQGATALCLGPGVTWDHAASAELLFRAVGPVVVRIDERLMDAFTALASSGPAYLFYLANAMIDAGVKLGFDPATSDRLVRQTITGAAALLAQSTSPPADLIAAVKSKGGTTEAALNVLARENVHNAFIAALTAARDRGRELSQ